MATAAAQSTEMNAAPVEIDVQNSNSSLEVKRAELSSDEDAQNKVTVGCVEALGYSMTTASGQRTSIKLIWAVAGGDSSREDTFAIVRNSTLTYDFKLNDDTSDKLLRMRRGRSAFPSYPKGKKGTEL